jgi:hypothetical protein
LVDFWLPEEPGENLWVAVGELVVNGGGGFVGCQYRRWRCVSVMKKKKKKRLMRIGKVVRREKIIIF